MSDAFDYALVSSNVTSKVRPEAVRECLKRSFKDPKTRLPDESLNLVTEIIHKLVIEAALRSAKQAVRDHVTCVEIEQVEKILPQLMLDLP